MSRYLARPTDARPVPWWKALFLDLDGEPIEPDAIQLRLDLLQQRGMRGERCLGCLDCTRDCSSATDRPVRRGWRARWIRPTGIEVPR